MKANESHQKYRSNFKCLDNAVLVGYEHLAALTGIPKASLYSMKCHGELPSPVIERNRLVRWTAGQIRTWIDELAKVAATRQDDAAEKSPRIGRPRAPV